MSKIKPTYIKGDYKISDFFNEETRIVCGCSGLCSVWRPIKEKEAIETLLFALDNGISAFDTVPSYNKSQEYLGKTLKEWQGKKPFISTKVGRLRLNLIKTEALSPNSPLYNLTSP